MVTELVPSPSRFGQKVYFPDNKVHSLAWNLKYGFEEYKDAIQGNKIRIIDNMTYASDGTAQAAWVASNAVATTGIAVTRDAAQYVNGTSSVLFTTGTSTYAADVTVTKTLTPDITNYPEDYGYDGYQNWSIYNYLGMFRRPGQALDAADIDIVLTDWQSRTAIASLAATTSSYNSMWQYTEVVLADMTESDGFDWTRVASIGIFFDDGMGTTETMGVDEILLYKYSNGHGPVVGNMILTWAGEASMVRGQIVKLLSTSAIPTVVSANDGDAGIVGIACSDGDAGDVMFVQVSGIAIVELGALTSLEAGDGLGCADNSGLTVTEAASTMADSFCRYLGVVDSAAQYHLVKVMLGVSGATPS